MALALAWLDDTKAARWWLAMASRAVRSRAGVEVIAEAEGESEREESGRGFLHYNHARRDKVVPTWDGGDRWCTLTIASPRAVSRTRGGDRREPLSGGCG
jgi:hypothetical protein